MTTRQRVWRYVCLGILWAVVLSGALNSEPLFAAVFGPGHSICGSWGCAAPLPTLLQWHTSVATVLFPLAWLSWKWSWLTMGRRSWHLMLTIALGTSAYVIADAVIWVMPDAHRDLPNIMNRALYTTLSQTDIPCLPLIAASILAWLRCLRCDGTGVAS